MGSTGGQYCYACGGENADGTLQQECPPETSPLLQTGPPPTRLVYACRSDGVIYAAALYWSAMTITSIGYGDVAATPGNAFELMLCAVLMLAAGFAW